MNRFGMFCTGAVLGGVLALGVYRYFLPGDDSNGTPAVHMADSPVDKPVDKPVDQTAEREVDQAVDHATDRTADHVAVAAPPGMPAVMPEKAVSGSKTIREVPPAAKPNSYVVKGVTNSEIMATNDLNGNGIVTKEEATRANTELIARWDFYDMNSDGQVDDAEITSANRAGGKAIQAARGPDAGPNMPVIRMIMRNNDLNGDGTITKAEAEKKNGTLIKEWNRYDFDASGTVDEAEVIKAESM